MLLCTTTRAHLLQIRPTLEGHCQGPAVAQPSNRYYIIQSLGILTCRLSLSHLTQHTEGSHGAWWLLYLTLLQFLPLEKVLLPGILDSSPFYSLPAPCHGFLALLERSIRKLAHLPSLYFKPQPLTYYTAVSRKIAMLIQLHGCTSTPLYLGLAKHCFHS